MVLAGSRFAPRWDGIWSIHFIDILHFQLPVPVAYDVALKRLPLAIAMLLDRVRIQRRCVDALRI
jgi:NO-binding membrane sensor protein with MHYT domain